LERCGAVGGYACLHCLKHVGWQVQEHTIEYMKEFDANQDGVVTLTELTPDMSELPHWDPKLSKEEGEALDAIHKEAGDAPVHSDL
jgi:hypothetical protein